MTTLLLLIFYITTGIIITILGIAAVYYRSAYKCALNEINTLNMQMIKFVRESGMYVEKLNHDCRKLDLKLDKLSSDLHDTQDQSENSNNNDDECKG